MNGMKIQRRKMGRNLDEYKFDLERARECQNQWQFWKIPFLLCSSAWCEMAETRGCYMK